MKNQGFTLLEIMIVIAIVGLIVAIAAPRFEDFKESASFKGGVRTVYSTLKNAKVHAIKRNRVVQVSFTDHSCTITSDDNADNVFETTVGTVFINEKIFIRNINFSNDNNDFVRFNPMGFPRDSDNINFDGSLDIELNHRSRTIEVNESGDIEIE